MKITAKSILLKKFLDLSFVKSHMEIFLISVFYLVFGTFIFRNLLLHPGIWNYGDSNFPVNEQSLNNLIHLVSGTWWDHEFLGYDVIFQGIPRISYVGLLTILHFFLRDFSVAQFFWHVLIFAISGLSMYFLTHYLFKKGTIALVASLFYALNPWIVDRMIACKLICHAYAFIPLLFAFYILLLDKKQFKYAIYFAIAFFFVIPSPHLTFLTVALLFAYFLYRLLTQRKLIELKSCFLNSLKVAGITIPFLAFYIFPFFQSLVSGEATPVKGIHSLWALKPWLYYAAQNKLINVIRLMGYHDSVYTTSFISEAGISWVLLTFLVPILLVLPLLLKPPLKEFKKIKYFLYPLLLIGIFLSASATLVSETAYGKVFSIIPLSNDPNYYVFILTFIGALLVGVGVYSVITKIQYIFKKKLDNSRGVLLITAVLLILFVCAISSPLLLWKDYRYEQIQYPADYDQLSGFLDQPGKDFRIYVLPPYWETMHKWAPYYVCNLDRYLLPKPSFGPVMLEATPQTSFEFSALVKSSISSNFIPIKNLALGNVKYIVLIDDLTWGKFYDQDFRTSEDYSDAIRSQKDIGLEKQFGDISIYKIADERFLPHIYSTDKFTFVSDMKSMFEFVGRENLISNDTIFFLEAQLRKDEVEKLKKLPEYKKYNILIPNNFNDSSFENGTWRDVGDCCDANPGKAEVYASLSDDSSDGKKSLNLTSFNHCACVSEEFPNFDKNAIYRLSFDYKHVSGESPRFCAWVTGCNKCMPTKYLDDSTEWETHTEYLSFPDCADSAILFLYSDQASIYEDVMLFFYSESNGQITTNLYDNVKTKKIKPCINETNLFEDPSFEKGIWQSEVGDCCDRMKGKAEIFASLTNDASEGNHSLNLTSKNHCACIKQAVTVEKNACYEISFDYKHISGNAPKFCLWRNESLKCEPLKELEKANTWKTYSFTFCTTRRPVVTTNLYDNVKLEKEILTNKTGYKAEVSFKKWNPTKYQIKIENATKPFFLIFSESYHPQWKAYAEDKSVEFKEIIASYDRVKVKEARHGMSFTPGDISYLSSKPLPDDKHFLVNGYANAWYIDTKEVDKDGDGSFVVTLYFLPQSLFYLGLFISGMTFIGCVGYLGYDWRRGRRRRRGGGWAKTIYTLLFHMRKSDKSTGSQKLFVKVTLVVVVLVFVSLGMWYSSLATDSDILVLDKSVLTVVVDDIPESKGGAVALAQETIINVTRIPESAFNRYFRLMNVSRTQFQWLLLYNVTGNPNLSVNLVKRISADEGFKISDGYIVGMVGADYFNAHFNRENSDPDTNTAFYSFNYPLSQDDIQLTMWVKLGNDRRVIGRHIVTTPQEVEVSLERAIEIGRMNGLQDPLSGHPVLTGGVLCWRVVWEHAPTEQDYDAQTMYGIDVHCTTGEVIGTHRYVRPKPTPPPRIQNTHIAALIEKLGLEELEDGAIIQLYVLNSSNEEFSVTKTFGQMVIKGDRNENADITLWIDREIIVNALESDDAMGYVRAHAEKGRVRVALHKNVVLLQKKGYTSLYENLKL